MTISDHRIKKAMAANRIELMDIKQLIRLKIKGKSNRKIAHLLHISRNTVNSYVQLLSASNQSWPELLAMDDAALVELFPTQSSHDTVLHEQLCGYFPAYVKELTKSGCTLLNLWHTYISKHVDGYKYTQFVHYFRQWQERQQVSGKLEHKAGEKVYVDFTGKKLEIINRHSGEIQQVEVFVAILPASHYTFVTAVCSQGREDFISAMAACLSFFGGVPEVVVSDNLKAAVSKSCKYQPQINKTLKDFALHYSCVVDPARAYHPQDKALVENAVKLVYQRIFYPLSQHRFFSLAELNKEIALLLETFNEYRFQHLPYSRKELFIEVEKPLLSVLPATAYTIRYYARGKVQKMGHVFFSADKHYYSAPHRYVGQQVQLEYNQDMVEIYHNRQRIAIHQRDYRPGQYTTVKEHMSSTHQYYSSWSLEFFAKRAAAISPEVEAYITKLIAQYNYPELGYKQAQGILSLVKAYGKERVGNACRIGLRADKLRYQIIANILKNYMDQEPETDPATTHLPTHANIRGAQAYQ
jgi:transposase